ncbi:MAG: TonB-dependent receptor plug domain-containing protein [Brevundimonas sp.]
MRRLLFVSATLSALASPCLASGQEPDPAETTEVAEVVVTATRLPALQLETPGARVVDRREIERRGAVLATDLFAAIPVLTVTRAGPFGGLAQVRIRGAAPGKTLVLIDGAPVNDPAEVNGAYDLGGLDLAGVARVETLSGPQSSLWGSDAIGGVIALTTAEVDGIGLEAEAGSFGTRRGRLEAGRQGATGGLSVYASRVETDGISAADERDGNVEADGMVSVIAGLKARRDLGPVQLDGSLRYSELDADIDGFPAPRFALADTADRIASRTWSGAAGLSFAAAGLQHRLSVSGLDLERDTVSAFPSRFVADRTIWRWQAEGGLGERLAVVGGVEHDAATGSISTGGEETLTTTSAFLTGRWALLTGLNLTAALRHDATDDFGEETTGRISAAWSLPAGLVLSGAWGTGFKAPSISQALCDYCFSSQPFPRLRPETAEGGELALGWRSGDGRLEGRITAYRLEVEDQISYVFDPVTFDSVYVNLARTKSEGIELEGRAVLRAGFDLTLAYATIDAVNAATVARLARVPEQTGSVRLGWSGARGGVNLIVRGESEAVDPAGPRDGFVVGDLTGRLRLTEEVELTARVINLTDEAWQQVRGYGEPGRSAYLGVRLAF